MISIYSSLFNYKTCRFDIDDMLNNFCNFAEEVVIATIVDKDDTFGTLLRKGAYFKNLKVYLSNKIPFTPDFDGAIKNDALQACGGDILIGLDADERIPLRDKERWISAAKFHLFDSCYDALLIPSLNLCGDLFSAKDVGQKWYMHRRGLKRGTVDFARRQDGSHDTSKSDSCELLTQDNKLCTFYNYMMRPLVSNDDKTYYIYHNKIPFVFHLGYLDLERRAEINQKFWKKQWSAEEGKEVNLPLTSQELETKTFSHNLKLWMEP